MSGIFDGLMFLAERKIRCDRGKVVTNSSRGKGKYENFEHFFAVDVGKLQTGSPASGTKSVNSKGCSVSVVPFGGDYKNQATDQRG
jgi:hypothetical protein